MLFVKRFKEIHSTPVRSNGGIYPASAAVRRHLTVPFSPVYNERNRRLKPCRSIPFQKGVSSLAGGKKVWRYLLRFLGVLLSVALLALLAASLILAKPQEEKAAAAADKPSAQSRPAVTIDQESDLIRLVSDFPAPVMSFMSGSGMVFVSATSADMAVSGGFGRMATLYWQTPEGEPMTLRSIWPAGSLDLLEDGFHFVPYAGPSLFSNTSVRMESDDFIRLHVATDQALYIVLLPRSLRDQVSSLCRSLQLFTANPKY